MYYSVTVDTSEEEFFRTTIKTDCFRPNDPLEDLDQVFYACGAEFKGVVSVQDQNGNMMMEAGFG